MAATTISRTAWTDGASGTRIDNAAKTALYDEIDALFPSAFTFGDVVNAEGLGTHLWSGSGTGGNVIRVRNSVGGSTNYSGVQVGNDTDADAAGIEMYASSFTETGAKKQDGLRVFNVQDGGVSIAAEHASGAVRLYAAGTSKIATFDGDTFALSGGTPGAYSLRGVLASSMDTSSVGTDADTAEKDLLTFALPASTLATNGQAIMIHAFGTTASNANNKTLRLYFGSTQVAASSARPMNDVDWYYRAIVIRTGAATQLALGTWNDDIEQSKHTYTAPTETLSGSITCKITGQNSTASASDIVARAFWVELLP